MRLRRLGAVFLTCLVMFSLAMMPVSAASVPSDSAVVLRAGGRINYTAPKNSITPIGTEFYLEKGDSVSFNCTYTPKSASMDFGVIDADGLFSALNCTSGSINKSFTVGQSGQYTIAIRNNEGYAVTVTGTIKY